MTQCMVSVVRRLHSTCMLESGDSERAEMPLETLVPPTFRTGAPTMPRNTFPYLSVYSNFILSQYTTYSSVCTGNLGQFPPCFLRLIAFKE